MLEEKNYHAYNYDYSYAHTGQSGQAATNFNVGDTVELRRTSNNATLNGAVTIIDKWTFTDADGIVRQRFRFSSPPELSYTNGVPSITAFYMTDGTNNWNMVTYNHLGHSGTVPDTLSVDVTVSTPDDAPLTMDTGSNPGWFTDGFEGL